MHISCNLLNTVLKVKNGMVVWGQSDFKCISCLPHDHVADWELQLTACHCAAL